MFGKFNTAFTVLALVLCRALPSQAAGLGVSYSIANAWPLGAGQALAPAPTLGLLGLATTTLMQGGAAGTILTSISGRAASSVITIDPSDTSADFAVSGGNLLAGPNYSALNVGAMSTVSLDETLAGASNSPHLSSIPVVVGSVLATKNIASNVAAPGLQTGGVSNGTDTAGNFRSTHWNDGGQAQSCIQLVYSGWFTNLTNEQDDANSYTVSASVEYPSGTFTQTTWSGVPAASVAPGSNLVSDPVCPAAGIPSSAQFWVRTHISVASGQVWPKGADVVAGSGFAEAGESGVGLADKTMGGTISGAATGLRPSAILGSTTRSSWMLIGDSIEVGAADGNYGAHGGTGMFARAVSGVAPFMQVGVTGTKASDQALTGKLARRLALARVAGIDEVQTDFGTNDLTGSGAAPALEASLLNIARQFTSLGAQFYVSTIIPRVVSADLMTSEVNQSPPNAAFTFGSSAAARNVINDWERSVPAGITGYFELSDAFEPSRYDGHFRTGCAASSVHVVCSTDTWTIAGTSSVTTFGSNSTRPSAYYSFGGAVTFTSGVLAGKTFKVTASDGEGNFTTLAMPTAPAVGDTFNAFPETALASGDGTHPNVTGIASPFFGGVYIGVDVLSRQFGAATHQ